MTTLYMLIGVPGSGKSTWAKSQNWIKICTYISTDELVEEYAKRTNSTYNEVFQEYMPEAVKVMTNMVIEARKAGKDIVWDQTSCTVITRAKKIKMLPHYRKIAVVFKTPPETELRARLDSRPDKIIPWEVVSDMANKLEQQPVTLEEGFDEIWFT